MTDTYYVHRHGTNRGPFTSEEILRRIEGATLAADDLIALGNQWVSISDWRASLGTQPIQDKVLDNSDPPKSVVNREAPALLVMSKNNAPAVNVVDASVNTSALRYANLPRLDWADHCGAGRIGLALAAVNVERLRTSLDISVETAAYDTGTSLEQVRSLVHWDIYQQHLDRVTAAHATYLSTADVQEVGAMLQKGVQLVGDCMVTTPVGALLAGLASAGLDKMVESQGTDALNAMQTALDEYARFVGTTLESVFVAPEVATAYQRRTTWRGFGVLGVLIGAVAGVVIAVRIGYYSSEKTTEALSPVLKVASASAQATMAPASAGLASVEAEPAGTTGLAQKSSESRATCLKHCAMECNDDSSCKKSCSERKCR